MFNPKTCQCKPAEMFTKHMNNCTTTDSLQSDKQKLKLIAVHDWHKGAAENQSHLMSIKRSNKRQWPDWMDTWSVFKKMKKQLMHNHKSKWIVQIQNELKM